MAFDVQLVRREKVAHETTAFHFTKPAGFAFEPGQAIDIILPGKDAVEGADGRHAFSIVSAPSDTEIVVATRMRDSAFKRVLKDLPAGSPLQLDGPFGSLTLQSQRPAVFVAGGIGITPFMSILRHAAREQLPQDLALLYANRRPEDAAFLAELQALQQDNRRFRLLATMTRMAQSALPWDGKTRPVDQALLLEIAGSMPAPIWYVAGPPAMVSAVQATLGWTGVDQGDIRIEEFFGY